jgi:hypothetical protein
MGPEVFFDTVLSTGPSLAQQAFECPPTSRLLFEEAQALTVCCRVERVFTRLQLPVPARAPELSDTGLTWKSWRRTELSSA